MGVVPCVHNLLSTKNETQLTYRKKVKHYDIAFHAHELTFSCYHRYDYLNDTSVCEMFLEELEVAGIRFDFTIRAPVRFAKRQITWFRKETRIQWFPVTNDAELMDVAEQVVTWIKD